MGREVLLRDLLEGLGLALGNLSGGGRGLLSRDGVDALALNQMAGLPSRLPRHLQGHLGIGTKPMLARLAVKRVPQQPRAVQPSGTACADLQIEPTHTGWARAVVVASGWERF